MVDRVGGDDLIGEFSVFGIEGHRAGIRVAVPRLDGHQVCSDGGDDGRVGIGDGDVADQRGGGVAGAVADVVGELVDAASGGVDGAADDDRTTQVSLEHVEGRRSRIDERGELRHHHGLIAEQRQHGRERVDDRHRAHHVGGGVAG